MTKVFKIKADGREGNLMSPHEPLGLSGWIGVVLYVALTGALIGYVWVLPGVAFGVGAWALKHWRARHGR